VLSVLADAAAVLEEDASHASFARTDNAQLNVDADVLSAVQGIHSGAVWDLRDPYLNRQAGINPSLPQPSYWARPLEVDAAGSDFYASIGLKTGSVPELFGFSTAAGDPAVCAATCLQRAWCHSFDFWFDTHDCKLSAYEQSAVGGLRSVDADAAGQVRVAHFDLRSAFARGAGRSEAVAAKATTHPPTPAAVGALEVHGRLAVSPGASLRVQVALEMHGSEGILQVEEEGSFIRLYRGAAVGAESRVEVCGAASLQIFSSVRGTGSSVAQTALFNGTISARAGCASTSTVRVEAEEGATATDDAAVGLYNLGTFAGSTSSDRFAEMITSIAPAMPVLTPPDVVLSRLSGVGLVVNGTLNVTLGHLQAANAPLEIANGAQLLVDPAHFVSVGAEDSSPSNIVLNSLSVQTHSLLQGANLTIFARTILVASTAEVSVSGRGYPGGQGPGAGAWDASAGTGGSHGGLGGSSATVEIGSSSALHLEQAYGR
jgi:hypothetical protein